MGSLAPVDTFVIPKAQGTPHKRDQKDCKNQGQKINCEIMSSRNDLDAAPKLP